MQCRIPLQHFLYDEALICCGVFFLLLICAKVTVMHSMQAGYLEKAQKYTDKALMQLEKLKSKFVGMHSLLLSAPHDGDAESDLPVCVSSA